MNYAVVIRHEPFAGSTRPPEVMHHVTVLGADRSLCGMGSLEVNRWEVVPDLHPEDVSAIDRCDNCYSALGVYRRQEREGGRANWGQRTLADLI
jgi:hypothetical protein